MEVDLYHIISTLVAIPQSYSSPYFPCFSVPYADFHLSTEKVVQENRTKIYPKNTPD